MLLDGIVVIIVIGSMVQGYRHGLLQTFIHTVGWLISLVLGFVLLPKVKEIILDNTSFYDWIFNNISEKVNEFLPAETMQSEIPSILQHPFLTFTDSLSSSVSESLSSFILTILCFLIIALLFHIFFFFLSNTFSRKHNKGITGLADGVFGILFGFVKGIIISYILLASMFPITALINTDLMNSLAMSLSNSHFANDLYRNNLILLIVRDIL